MSAKQKPTRYWTKDEDALLREAVAKYEDGEDINWGEVASHIPERDNKACRKRWVYTLAPCLNKGSWSQEEDSLLLKGVEIHGFRWALVSQVIGSRQPDQCSRRWHESLNPNIDKGRWSLLEDQTLNEAVQIHGRRWTEIAGRYFPTRTPLAVKSRYTQRFEKRDSGERPPQAAPWCDASTEGAGESIDNLAAIRDSGNTEVLAPNIPWHLSDYSQDSQQHLAANHTTVTGTISTNTPILATTFTHPPQLAVGKTAVFSSRASSFPTSQSPPCPSTPDASSAMDSINSSPFPFHPWPIHSMPQRFDACTSTGMGDMGPSQQQDAFFHISARQPAAPGVCGMASGYPGVASVQDDLDLDLGLDLPLGVAMVMDADNRKNPGRCFSEMGPGMEFEPREL